MANLTEGTIMRSPRIGVVVVVASCFALMAVVVTLAAPIVAVPDEATFAVAGSTTASPQCVGTIETGDTSQLRSVTPALALDSSWSADESARGVQPNFAH